MNSLDALLPDDLEKHVQLNRARLTSYGVLRKEIKTYCECRGHAARNAKQKGPSHPGGDDPMDIGAFGKGKGKQNKGKHGKGTGKGKQGQHGQQGLDKDKNKNKDSIDCWNWKARTLLEGLLGRERCQQRWFERESTEPRMQQSPAILTRRSLQMLNQKLKSVDST